MLHGKKIGGTIAYDVYRECAEGDLDKDWKLDKVVDFYRFREKLASQQLTYDPSNRHYPGDSKLRVATQQHKSRRPLVPGELPPRSPATPATGNRSVASCSSSSTSGVSADDVKEAGKRLCGDFSNLMSHYHSLTKFPGDNTRVCAVCGKRSTYYCSLCGATVHHPTVARDEIKGPCFIQWHNTMFLGLARDDYKLVGITQKSFVQPTEERQKQHAIAMKAMLVKEKAPLASTRSKRKRSHSDQRNNEDSSSDHDDSQVVGDVHAFRFNL